MTELPAGGKVDLEIACNVAWTSFRPETATKEGSALDACPDNPGELFKLISGGAVEVQ